MYNNILKIKFAKGDVNEPMKTKKEEFIDSLINGGMMDNIYGYAYKRCFSKDEAEELCQEIITEILFALTNDGDISNLNAYVWQVANNTYINHINRNKRIQGNSYSFDDMLSNINATYEDSMEDDIIERIVDRERLAIIKREIASLSEIYRDVMIMYYLEELPMSVIAKRLDIPENRVKQRLYTAREKIRKEVLDMNTTKAEKTVKLYDLMLAFWGGNLFKYDPRDKISSSLLKKNIIISCRKTAKSIQELSDEFDVSPTIMKDEIKQIPEDFLKKVGGEKYIANSIVIEIELQERIDKLIADITADYFKDIKKYLLSQKDAIMKLPYINPPKSFEYLLWWYLPQFADVMKRAVSLKIAEKIKEKNLKSEERKVEIICSILDPDKKEVTYKGENHNGIWNVFNMLGHHEEVRIENISITKYLPWEKGRFFAGQNFNHFPELAMVFKTIDGLDVNSISESDKEATAKALEKGYIRKENGKLYPNVTIAPESTSNYLALNRHFGDVRQIFGVNESATHEQMITITDNHAEKMAGELWDCANKYLPEHLLYLSGVFASSIMHFEYYLLEEGVKDGILYELPETGCTEAIFASIHYPKLKVNYEEAEVKNGFLVEYKISEVLEGGAGEKIGLKKGDIMIAVNGTNWVEYWKKAEKPNGNNWKDGDIITVDRNGKNIDVTVTF